MIIIVEGVDGVGKTTLVERLVAATNAKTLHAAQPKSDNAWDEYVAPLAEYADDESRSPHLVLDRWHWGEMIYGPIYRGASIVDESAFFVIDSYLNAMGAIVVHLSQTDDVILDRWKKRGEDFAQKKDLPALTAAYASVSANSRVPVLRMVDPGWPQIKRILSVALAFEATMNELRDWSSR